MTLEELREHSMDLPDSDRARLAADLLDSLSPGGPSAIGKESPAALASPLQKENRNAGKFHLVLGLIFLAWTACDLMSGFEGWASYADISFGLLAIAFIVYGTSQIKAAGGL